MYGIMLNSHLVFGSLHSTVLLHVVVAHSFPPLCVIPLYDPFYDDAIRFWSILCLMGISAIFQFLPIMCSTAMNTCVFCWTYAFIFSYTIYKNWNWKISFIFQNIGCLFFPPELFPIGPTSTRGFYFPPSCHKSWPCDLFCPIKHNKNNVCHFQSEALRIIAWFCHCAFHSA